MKKLVTSIIVLITTTVISYTYTDLDSNTSVESLELKKEIISANSLTATSKD